MLQQTIDQVKPLLGLLQQPAFCLGHDGSLYCSPAARLLVPGDEKALPGWLGSAAQLYDQWSREEPLTISVPLDSQVYSVCIQALTDGTLFLLSAIDPAKDAGSALSVAAQVMRQPLTDLYALSQRLFAQLEETEDPMFLSQTAAMMRQLYRLVRISGNLADWQQFQNGSWKPHLTRIELLEFLEPRLEELLFHCQDTGHDLRITVPRKPVRLQADEGLLERALYNLFSNAMKYSEPGSPLRFWVELTPSAVFFKLQNQCSPEHTDLLTSAFRRMEDRGLLPNPQWGIGLGLPICQRIAALHNGTVALELLPGDLATVTMSIRRKTFDSVDVVLETPLPRLHSGGLRRSLVELSDALPSLSFDTTAL